MPTARCTFSTGVVNERIYAIGGAKGRTDALRSAPLQIVEEYNPATDTWMRKADMPTARNALSLSVMDGRIYAFGGAEGIGAPLNTVEEYHPATDTWTNKADMPTARFALSTSAVNGKIYAIGGSMGGFKALSTVEQYDPVTDVWTKKADMPTARIHISTSVVDGKIYAIGGVTGTSAYASRAVEQYDPATDTWTRKANMPSAGCTLSTSVVNGKIYAMGGSSPMPALAPLSTVQEYDPVTDKWTNKTGMPTARSGLSTSAVNGKIYAIGGLANPTGMALAIVEEYDTGFTVTPPAPDFNGDGIVDSADVCIMVDHWGENYPLCDIAPPPFGDGIIDIQDLNLLSEYLLEEIMLPVANAGLSRYAAREPVILDGTGSYDPDDSGSLSYAWRQISGPSVEIVGADTSGPAISGFVQTDEIQECEFELVVSDGELTSLPDSVKIIIVPDFGSKTLKLENASFDTNKPTVIYFGGGDDINGYSGQPWNGGSAWTSRANVIGFPNGYTRDSGGGKLTYYKYGDMIIAYLSAVAPDYRQPVQTIGWSGGAEPAIDVGIRLNGIYGDARYAVNHVTQLDGGVRITEGWSVYLENIQLFLTSSVDGEQCWIDHYYGILAYPYEPVPHSEILYVRSGLAHNQVHDWYRNSLTNSDMNNFNRGIVGGAYWSVIGPGKNLQLAPETGVYYFLWNGNQQTGAMSFFSQSEYPGKLPEPVTLIVLDSPLLPEDDPNGVVLTCTESENAVGYQLLSGSDPYNVADYNIMADGNSPPEVTVAMLPSSDTWWTVKVRDAHGSTIYADPIRVGLPVGVIAYWKFDEVEGSIAEDTAGDNDGVLLGEPMWQPAEGKINGALSLDGIDDYANIGFALDPSEGPFSVFAWIKGGAPGQVIISQTDGTGSGETWLGTESSEGKLMTGLIPPQAGRTAPLPLVSESIVTDGQWHHIGFVWDGAYRFLYVDGAEVAKDTTAQNPPISATGGLYIGAGKTLDAGTFFSGLIDDIRIYDKVLTIEQIEALAR
ncbi:MAG TPA: LamG-like jellyroll fold domain-containing protein [Sedimentisphaerales bacterium]|nr:LamG-like jellyroll fold domain-containing protein [Sedimentisphaerales bacterium]